MVTRFHCSGCERLAPLSAFQVEASELVVTCARCGARNVLERAASTPAEIAVPQEAVPPALATPPRVVSLRPVDDAVGLAREAAISDDPFRVPGDRCPKCIAERSAEALSCPHCGLVYVNYREEETAPSAELQALMRAALSAWDDPSAHERILALATARGELPQAGRFYRLRLAAAPLDPVAQRGRDDVLERAAAGHLLPRASLPEPRRNLVTWVAAFGLVVGLAVLAWMLLR